MLQRLDIETREAMLPMLLDPVIRAMRGVMERAKGQINRQWEVQVYDPCQRRIAARYPFRALGDDAPLEDVINFFHPRDGTLWKFYKSEVELFVVEGLDRWKPRTWNGVGLELSAESLDALRYARFLSKSLFPVENGSFGSRFELFPYPAVGPDSHLVNEIRLDVGGQTFRYRMEPQEWHEMEWPGPSAAEGASLLVSIGTSWESREQKDWWGLFRLLSMGEIIPLTPTQFRVQWEIVTPDMRTVQVQYEIRSRSFNNPFREGLFQGFHCVHQL